MRGRARRARATVSAGVTAGSAMMVAGPALAARRSMAGARVALATMLIAIASGVGACERSAGRREARLEAMSLTGGDPDGAPALLRHYGCVSCHTIPGIQGANATVGPPLTRMARRSFIAGVLPNTPSNMERWIMDPPAVDSLTAMPTLGVSVADARTIAAYLYTLR